MFSSLFDRVSEMIFEHDYKCYPCSFMPGDNRPDVDTGGKIIMPPSALDSVTRLNIPWPLLFSMYNPRNSRSTHCGVLEFVAEEGRIYIPYWMFRLLCLEEGQRVTVKSATIPKGQYVKFQPQSPDFVDIHNPKAVLERVLRQFACLTKGDTISITYNDREYEIYVLETKPADAISIIECDLNVDFATPIGYKEKERDLEPMEEDEPAPVVVESSSFKAFGGQGNVLGRKKKKHMSMESTSSANIIVAGPDVDFKIGKIVFVRTLPVSETSTPSEEQFEAFSGTGKTIKQKRKK